MAMASPQLATASSSSHAASRDPEEFALQELRKSVHVQTTDSNPFLSPGETMEEVEEEEDEEEYENGPKAHLQARHPYQRYNSSSTQNSRAPPPPEPRRH